MDILKEEYWSLEGANIPFPKKKYEPKSSL